jgi:hypothetical protein
MALLAITARVAFVRPNRGGELETRQGRLGARFIAIGDPGG